MAQCKHHEICGLTDEFDHEAGLCILHSHQPHKDQQTFDEALAAHRKCKGDQFSWIVFPGEAHFSGMTFTDDAHFSGVTFTKAAHFSGATFTGLAYFFYAKFTDAAHFSGTTFTGRAEFSHAKFTVRAEFSNTIFTNDVDFHEATFKQAANFGTWGVDFGMIKFLPPSMRTMTTNVGATFKQATHFSWTTFAAGADFDKATFLGDGLFQGTRFSGPTTFRGSRFAGKLLFTGLAEGQGDDAQRGSRIDEKIRKGIDSEIRRLQGLPTPKLVAPVSRIFEDAAEDAAEVDFRDLVIEVPESLSIRQADFRTCRLLNTDLRKVELTGVRWPQKGARRVVYEEKPILKKEDYPWEELERLYRELKQNYDERRNYARMGDFHYGEKEMQRRNPRTPLGLKVFLWLYWLVSGYGERFLRPLLWTVGLLVVATGAYLWWGLVPKPPGVATVPEATGGGVITGPSGNPPPLAITNVDWLSAMHYSFCVMTLLKPEDLVPLGFAKVIHTLQSLLGPLFLGLFALAVRQRLKH